MRVWITRAQPGADQTAARLIALGRTPLVASLLEIGPLPMPPDLLEGVTALAFTSAHAVWAAASLPVPRDLPVFTVGDATARGAEAAGFTRVRSADGDFADLGALLQRVKPAGVVLHPCAVEPAGDLSAAAPGVEVRSVAVYAARAVAALPPQVETALGREEVDAVLLHSPRAARTLAALLRSLGPSRIGRLRAFGLSAVCLAPLDGLPFAFTAAAAAPREADLLALLG